MSKPSFTNKPTQSNDLLSEGIEDVNGIIRDALAHEERAASHLDKIGEDLGVASGLITRVSERDESAAIRLGYEFAEQLGARVVGDDGVGTLIRMAEEAKYELNRSIDELNSIPTLNHEMLHALDDDPMGKVLLGFISTSFAACGALLGGALAGPVGIPAGAAAALAAEGGMAYTVAGLIAINESLDVVSGKINYINEIAERLGEMAGRTEEALDWLQSEVNKLEDSEQ